jgi:acylphosphatase
LVIGGRVQGVGFRHFTKDTAVLEGVTGTVRNRSDGRVEAYLEGEREAVDRVERAIRRGPRGAQVLDVNVEEDEPSGAYTNFWIE